MRSLVTVLTIAAVTIAAVEPAWRTSAVASATTSPAIGGATTTDAGTDGAMTIDAAASPTGVDGGTGTVAAIACGLGVRGLILLGPIFGLILATVAVCTLTLFEGAADPNP